MLGEWPVASNLGSAVGGFNSHAASRAAARDELSARHQDLLMPSWRVRHAGGYLRDKSPDRARGWQDIDVGITSVCGNRLPERRAAPTAIQEQPLPEVGALG